MENIDFKNANFNYWGFMRNLRNNKDVLDGLLNRDYIDEDSHTNYMSENWKNYTICIDKG